MVRLGDGVIAYEEAPDGVLVAVSEVVVAVHRRRFRFPVGRWEASPPAGGLAGAPVVVCPDPTGLDLVLAGMRRSGDNPASRSIPGAGEVARDLLLAVSTGAEAIVIVPGGRGALTMARALGGRPITALPLTDREGLVSLFDGLEVDVNVPVPAAEGELRTAIREALAPFNLEAMHHLVDVDPRPAFDELGRNFGEATLSELGAAAAGVLAGRLAAASRRWRAELGHGGHHM